MDLVLGTLILRPYVFGFVAAFLLTAARDLGWRRTVLFMGWVWPVAWAAEFASTRVGVPFGLYHYTGFTLEHELYLSNVPLMDSLSFTFLAYAAFCLARRALGPGGSARAVTLTGGLLMMLLDVVIDPIAVRGDQWFLGRIFYYPEGGAYFGVPLSNFAGWAVVGMTAIGGYLALTGDGRGIRPEPGVALYYVVLAFNLAVTAWIQHWILLGLGVFLHATTAAVLYAVHRRPAAQPDMESQKA
jgi:putative membrane protein